MSKLIKTLDLKRWSEPDEKHRVKELGMANAQDIFNKLHAHLEENNLLPDEYFLFAERSFAENNGELFEHSEVICQTNFGGSEGVYLDISLATQKGFLKFATGKTLDGSAEGFYKMSRIGAECSLMLNGGGSRYEITEEQKNIAEYKLNS